MARLSDLLPQTLSVVVCTRDRPQDLELCLTSLFRKPLAGWRVPPEVPVIDNCPSDGASEAVAAQYPVTYVREMRLGKSIALNAAVSLARGEVIAFLDDDDFIQGDWADAIVQHFADPSVVYVSGLRLPFELRTEAQKAFHRRRGFSKGGQLRRFDPGYFRSVRWRGVPVYLVGLGGNCAFRRSALLSIGGFDELFGPGRLIWAGESTEVCYRLMRAGHTLVYDPAIVALNRYVADYATLRGRLFRYGLGDTAVQTKILLCYGDIRGLWEILYYKSYRQLLRLLQLCGDPEHFPAQLLLVEWCGNLLGPLAYITACATRQLRRQQ